MSWRLTSVIDEGQMLPPYHGVYLVDWQRNRAHTAVVPLNWLLSISNAVLAFIRFGNKSVADNPRFAYMQGYRDGKIAGFRAWKDGLK